MRYWAAWFGPLIRRGAGSVEIRYDPRDLSYIWVAAPTGWERVHLYRREEPFTLREHELALKWRREQADATVKEEDIHAFRKRSTDLVAEEARTTRKARRKAEHAERSIEASTSIFGEPAPMAPAPSEFTPPSRDKPKRIVEEW